LWTSTTDNAVTGAVLGQKVYDSVRTETSPHYALVPPKSTYSTSSSCVPNPGSPGFQIDVTRVLTKADQDPVRQVFHAAYAAQDRVVCNGGNSGTNNNSSTASGTGADLPTDAPAGSQPPDTTSPVGGTAGVMPSPSAGFPPGGMPPPGPVPAPPPTTPSTSPDSPLLGGLLGAPARH